MSRSRRSHQHSEAVGFRRRRRVADSMTRDYYAFVDSSLAAERVGDAETALEYYRGVPMFARSPHAANLAQLAGLAGELTPWLWARWAAYQCTRAEDEDTRSREAMRTALEYTVNTFYAHQMHDAYVEGEDPVRVTSVVAGEDWGFHQVCTHELDGLETFLDEFADGRLAEHAGLARSWAGARMGGYSTSARGSTRARAPGCSAGWCRAAPRRS